MFERIEPRYMSTQLQINRPENKEMAQKFDCWEDEKEI